MYLSSSHRQGSYPAVAVPPGPPPRPGALQPHPVDRERLRVPHTPAGGDRQAVGRTQEQATHELRQAEPRAALLLQQRDHGQGAGGRN